MYATKKNKNQLIKIPNFLQEKIEEIRLDHTSGSSELAKKSAELLIFLVGNISADSSSDLNNLLYYTTNELIRAQPAMASIFNLANTILIENSYLQNKEEIRKNVNDVCKKFKQSQEASSKIISNLTLELIKDNTTILTHSYSSTLLNAFIYTKKNGKNINIICTESRPMNEGVKLSKKLGGKKIKIRLIVDAGIYFIMPEADLILVGADAITTSGFVNKIGTYGISLAAKQYNKKLYVLCSTDKILPKGYSINLKDQKNPEEIISQSIENVKPINYYFELTPLKFASGIITERGILSTSEIKKYINKLKIHRILKNN